MKIHELITRDTWNKGQERDKNKLCALEWLYRAYGKGKDFQEAYIKLRKVIGFRPIVGWNDSQHTEYNEVITAFRKANI